MGVEPFLIASSVIAAVAQRLVRVLCNSCKEAYEASPLQMRQLGITDGRSASIYGKKGCPECSGLGYRGRKGIFELLMVTDEVRELVMSRANSAEIRRKSIEEGMRTLRVDGSMKVLNGLTSIEEVLRVTQDDTATY